VLKIGAATEVELKEKKHRIEDAVSTAKAAVEEGIVPGGGVALLRCQAAVLDRAQKLEGDEATGARIVARAVEEPLKQIAVNAGLEGGVIVREGAQPRRCFGLNAATGDYEDLTDKVPDAAKVTRSPCRTQRRSQPSSSPPRLSSSTSPKRRALRPCPAAGWKTSRSSPFRKGAPLGAPFSRVVVSAEAIARRGGSRVGGGGRAGRRTREVRRSGDAGEVGSEVGPGARTPGGPGVVEEAAAGADDLGVGDALDRRVLTHRDLGERSTSWSSSSPIQPVPLLWARTAPIGPRAASMRSMAWGATS